MQRVVVRFGFSCLLVLPALVGCRPLLDGGWEGEAVCDGDTFPLSAIFNETGDDELEGTVYIEQIFGGFIAKGTIDNGGFDPDNNSYDFQLQTDDDSTPELDLELELDQDDIDRLEGTAQILNDAGEVQDTCQVDLERVTVSD